MTAGELYVNNADIMSVQMTAIRQAHKDLTRERILDAAVELMAETLSIDVPTVDIAARAGVTERTVYRHFLSREALAEAVWPRVVARMQAQKTPDTAAELVQLPFNVFPTLDHSEALIRAAVYSDVARQVALQTNPARQASMLNCVDDALPHLDAAARRRRAALVLMASSAYGWAVLKDFGGLDGQEVAQAASEAVAILLGLQPAAGPSAASDNQDKNRT